MVAIRSKKEVEKIAVSSRIVADLLDFLEDKIVEGVSGKELDKISENYIRSRDAEPAFKGYMGYPATLCISVNDEVVTVSLTTHLSKMVILSA
jgi:methionyl aminopeptidase